MRLGSVRHGLSFVLDVGDVSVLVGDVRDDLGAAVGEVDVVLADGGVTVPVLLVSEVVVLVVEDSVFPVVVDWAL